MQMFSVDFDLICLWFFHLDAEYGVEIKIQANIAIRTETVVLKQKYISEWRKHNK